MGFEKNRSAHALIATDNSIDAAIDFIEAFMDDPTMNEPVVEAPVQAPAAWTPPLPMTQQPPPSILPVDQPAGYEHMIRQAQQQYRQQLTSQAATPKHLQPNTLVYAVNPAALVPNASGAKAQDEDDDVAELLALCGI